LAPAFSDVVAKKFWRWRPPNNGKELRRERRRRRKLGKKKKSRKKKIETRKRKGKRKEKREQRRVHTYTQIKKDATTRFIQDNQIAD
jgi:hypothetical protein